MDCGVPFVLVLGGTDMNADLADAGKAPTIRAAVRQAASLVAFDLCARGVSGVFRSASGRFGSCYQCLGRFSGFQECREHLVFQICLLSLNT